MRAPAASKKLTRYCCVAGDVISAFFGSSSMRATLLTGGGAGTEMTTAAWMFGLSTDRTVTLVMPAANAATVPPLLTVATAVLDDVQVTGAPTIGCWF